MNKTIGVLAHVDAGKTTFCEQVLYHTKSIRNRGRVDHKNTLLDSHYIEKERGITIFSDQAMFNYNESNYFLVDTPGHIDFSSEMERAIQIMDYAIIIVSASDGIQSHTETVWNLLRKHNIPTFFFVNKIDIPHVDYKNIIEEIKNNLSLDTLFIKGNLKDEQLDNEVVEFIAERDELILERYLECEVKKEECIKALRKMIKNNLVFPCFIGSALQDIGIYEFIDSLDILTYTNYNEDELFSGRVYKVKYDEDKNRITYIKVLKGRLKVKEEISVKCGNSNNLNKINQIRIYNGTKFKAVESVKAGELCGIIGIQNAIAGDGLGELKEKVCSDIKTTLKSKVFYDESLNIKDVLNVFKILEEEDPNLNVKWDEHLKELHVNIMGTIQLEILKDIIYERFNMNVDFGPCEILYKETIENETIGYGHFEPLKHYAEVHLNIKNGERGSGIVYESKCHSDDLTTGNQNLVGTHILEKEHRGILTGSPLTDLKITLLTGRAHNKHTCGGDFREATLRALRQGLEKANNILLEPYYNFKIEAEMDYMGRIISDIQKLNGIFESPDIQMDKVVIKGRGPVATFMDYGKELIKVTKGKGKISFNFAGYDVCHNSEEIIEKINYNKDADIEYTSSSVFCSKGQGFIVKGNEAENHMHCLK